MARATSFALVPDVDSLAGPGAAKAGSGQDLRAFQFNDVWGYIDLKANIVIPPTFAKAANFINAGVALVANPEGKTGLIDAAGAFVVQPGLEWGSPEETLDKTCVVIGRVGAYTGSLDCAGHWLLKPRLISAQSYSLDLYSGKYQDKFGLLSLNDGWLLKPEYDFITQVGFYDDPSQALLAFSQGSKMGLVDLKGEVLFQPRFESIAQLGKNQDFYKVKVGENQGVIDLEGQWVVPLTSDEITFKESLKEIWVKGPEAEKTFAYSLPKGEKRVLTLKELWASVGESQFKLAPCVVLKTVANPNNCDPCGRVLPPKFKKGDKGYCDHTGAIKFAGYEETGAYAGVTGRAKVKKGGKFGFVDPKGQLVIPYQYEMANDFTALGLALVKIKGFWGVINEKGRYVIQPTYDGVSINNNAKLIVVWKKDNYGVFRLNGGKAFDLIFEDYRYADPRPGLWIKYKGLWGWLDQRAQWVLKPKYNNIDYFDDSGIMSVLYKNKFALINDKFEFIAYNDVVDGQNVVKDQAERVIWTASPASPEKSPPPAPVS
ncbi:MAG: WG repeat-containing protein [Deltaproteobacteria bacterium]|nr:WG repeat-containing protein [Deltaproteobacteria bacterium]